MVMPWAVDVDGVVIDVVVHVVNCCYRLLSAFQPPVLFLDEIVALALQPLVEIPELVLVSNPNHHLVAGM